jgi:hypothetical protein
MLVAIPHICGFQELFSERDSRWLRASLQPSRGCSRGSDAL